MTINQPLFNDPELMEIFLKGECGFITSQDGTHIIAAKLKSMTTNHRDVNYIDSKGFYHIGARRDSVLGFEKLLSKNKEEDINIRVALYSSANGYIDKGFVKYIKRSGPTKFICEPVESTTDECLSQSSNTSQEDVEKPQSLKRPRSERHDYVPVPVVYKGEYYDSTLEARHAVFLDYLRLPFVHQPQPAFRYKNYNWAIDFKVWPDDNEKTFYLEVKPNRPTEEEEQKCEVVANSCVGVPVILVYGTMGSPYSHDPKCSPNGIYGIRWIYDGFVLKRDEVVWTLRSSVFSLQPKINTLDHSWGEKDLVEGYAFAYNYKF